MAAEVKTRYFTGNNLYFIVVKSDGTIWNGSSFVSINVSNWTTYAVTMTEQSTSGLYYGTFPTGITVAADYTLFVMIRTGASPATSDVTFKEGTLSWDGDSELGSTEDSLAEVIENTDNILKVMQAKILRT